MNNPQIGRIARALRHRLGLRQTDVAERVGVSHDVVSRLERGVLDGLPIRTLRRLFEAFDAEVIITVRWRGGELDRVVDRRHASLAEVMASRLRDLGWTVEPEVSFSEFGERGSIDLLCWRSGVRTLLVVEIKIELTSIEETIRRHDVKTRLAARIGGARFGSASAVVARLLVLPDDRTPRRQVERFGELLLRAYPLRGRAVRGWLREPSGPCSGLMFLTSADDPRRRQRLSPARRISRPISRSGGAQQPSWSREVGS